MGLNDWLLIFPFPTISVFRHPCPVRASPLPFLLQSKKGAHTETISIPLLLHTLSLCCLGSRFWLIYIDCYGPFSIPGAPEQKKKKKIQAFSFIKLAPARLQPQRTTVSFFFSFPPTLPVLFVFSSTNNCHVHKSQEGAAICYSSNLFNNTSNSR